MEILPPARRRFAFALARLKHFIARRREIDELVVTTPWPELAWRAVLLDRCITSEYLVLERMGHHREAARLLARYRNTR